MPTNQTVIKAILFDFDGVLTTDSTGSQSICNYICEKAGFETDIFSNAYKKHNTDLLYGKTKHESIWECLCADIGVEIDISLLHDSFINTPIDHQMMDLVHKLKSKQYKVGIITDNKKDRIDAIVHLYNWNSVFDAIAVSAHIGSGKDHVAIFETAINKLNLSAEECVFIDNQEKNLIVPKKMGMSTIFFDHTKKDYEKLFSELHSYHVDL